MGFASVGPFPSGPCHGIRTLFSFPFTGLLALWVRMLLNCSLNHSLNPRLALQIQDSNQLKTQTEIRYTYLHIFSTYLFTAKLHEDESCDVGFFFCVLGANGERCRAKIRDFKCYPHPPLPTHCFEPPPPPVIFSRRGRYLQLCFWNFSCGPVQGWSKPDSPKGPGR
ncbi:hypothetical protein DFH27DRAFT_327643 [Peziza echinospora]|nr:hypothetical protein DFH27DRAFT_327643 [Peziza echinospora]